MASSAFECEICNEDYNAADRKPICLPCGHTFCRKCLEDIERTNTKHCPQCRQPIVKPVAQLPVNYALISPSKIPVSETNSLSKVARCQVHGGYLDHFCADCGDILCRKCIRQSHQQHRVEHMNDILNRDEVAAKFTLELQSKIVTKVNNIASTLSTSMTISESLNDMKACKEEMQFYEDILLTIQTSASDDLSSWNETGPKSGETEYELFERLCTAWKESGVLLPDEETSSDFVAKVDELIASAGQVQRLAQELKTSIQQSKKPSNAPVGVRVQTPGVHHTRPPIFRRNRPTGFSISEQWSINHVTK